MPASHTMPTSTASAKDESTGEQPVLNGDRSTEVARDTENEPEGDAGEPGSGDKLVLFDRAPKHQQTSRVVSNDFLQKILHLLVHVLPNS